MAKTTSAFMTFDTQSLFLSLHINVRGLLHGYDEVSHVLYPLWPYCRDNQILLTVRRITRTQTQRCVTDNRNSIRREQYFYTRGSNKHHARHRR